MKKKESDKKPEKKNKRRFRRRAETDQLIRIEELEELMRKQGGEVDPEKIVSMYQPHRRRRKIGAALLRMDRLELYRRGISIADNGDFDGATARLTAATVKDATNISIEDLPKNLDSAKDGNHNGKNYMAYTYYVRNAGKEDLSYIARITLDSCSKGAEKAVRIAVWRNGKRVIYAAPAKNGGTEQNCKNFKSDDVVCEYEEKNFLVGNVDKYTIVIWMEGDDPECVDSIIGGSVELSMHIDTDFDDNTSLLWKFVQDIKDTLTKDKPINAAGNEAPNDSYYSDRKITWKNRRNK